MIGLYGLAILLCVILQTASSLVNENVTQLTSSSTLDCFWSWSPDGTKIAFTSNHSGISDIWVMDSNGSDRVQLTSAGGTFNPIWSPDGRKIAFTSNRSGNWDVWVMDSDGSNMVQLTTGGLFIGLPAWSPDGKKIAFSASFNWSDTMDIWIMNNDGSDRKQLTTGKESNHSPMWSPDGKKIAFTSDPDGNIRVMTIEEMTTPANTPTPTQMANTPAFGAAITIFGLLIVMYIVRQRR